MGKLHPFYKKLAENQELKNLLLERAAFQAQADVLRPIVAGIQTELLAKYNFADKNGQALSHDNLYLCDDDAGCEAYYNECLTMLDAKGLRNGLGEGVCPLLAAEHNVTKTESAIIDLVREAFGLPEIYKMEFRKRLLDMTFKCMGALDNLKN